MKNKKFNELVDYIMNDREREGKIWFIGMGDVDPITLSLRGRLNPDTLKWEAIKDEIASCCQTYSPGDDWKEHCSTREHIETMVKENYNLDRQHTFMEEIIEYERNEEV